jgi:hypothetical protein
MRSKTQFASCGLLLGLCVSSGLAQQPAKDQTPPKQAAGAQAGSVPETETILSPQLAQTPQPVNAPGFMDPAQVKALAHKIWMAEFRINDLLTQLRPDRWKVSNITRNSFSQTLENLHRALEGLEEWRAQFEKRPDSMYFGFQTYAAMNAALPRLEGVAGTANQFENSSLGAQYSQASNQLFDLQQALQPYLAYLLRNSDQLFYVTQTNLAGCQNELGNALRGQGGRATPLKNTFVELHARRPGDGQAKDRTSSRGGKKKPRSKTEKKAASQPQPH